MGIVSCSHRIQSQSFSKLISENRYNMKQLLSPPLKFCSPGVPHSQPQSSRGSRQHRSAGRASRSKSPNARVKLTDGIVDIRTENVGAVEQSHTEVFLWGSDEHGQLGLGDRSDSKQLQPRFVSFKVTIKHLSCGLAHTAFSTCKLLNIV